MSGTVLRVPVQRRLTCHACHGSGAAGPEHEAPCGACAASGRRHYMQWRAGGYKHCVHTV
jgi:DnaJ-class molecular chaperone